MEIRWEPGWEEELSRQLQPVIQQFADDHQPDMDALTQQYAGRPVSEIKPVIEREMAIWGTSLSDDDELMRVATAISEGQRVILRPAS